MGRPAQRCLTMPGSAAADTCWHVQAETGRGDAGRPARRPAARTLAIRAALQARKHSRQPGWQAVTAGTPDAIACTRDQDLPSP